jgi:DNA-entry nuclease
MSKKKTGMIIAIIFVALIGIIGSTDSPVTDTTDINVATTVSLEESIYNTDIPVSEAQENTELLTEKLIEKTTLKQTEKSTEFVTEDILEKAETTTEKEVENKGVYKASLSNIPAFSGKAYVVVNNNIPGLSASDRDSAYFEEYTPLDNLDRCGVAFACLGTETMPSEERGAIGSVKPSGWHTVKYDIVDGKYLYNRCHLIGFQLSGENANVRNLITGTRFMNMEGMLPFENMVADYIKETKNHVLYRVTPVFEGFDLVAKGVQIEGFSVEDDGDGICFNVFCYNSQPGVEIDYTTGESRLNGEVVVTTKPETTVEETEQPTEAVQETSQETRVPETEEIIDSPGIETMVWIPQSGSKYHSSSSCSNMKNPSQVSEKEAIDMGYEPCKRCH